MDGLREKERAQRRTLLDALRTPKKVTATQEGGGGQGSPGPRAKVWAMREDAMPDGLPSDAVESVGDIELEHNPIQTRTGPVDRCLEGKCDLFDRSTTGKNGLDGETGGHGHLGGWELQENLFNEAAKGVRHGHRSNTGILFPERKQARPTEGFHNV